MIDPNRGRLQTRSWFAVVGAYQECHRRYARLLAAHGLTVTQFDALLAVGRLGEAATPAAIAEMLVVTRGNLSGVFDRLRGRDLITIRPSEQDRRSYTVSLTAAGEHALAGAQRAAAAFIDRQLAPFDDDELRQTEAIMNRMRDHLLTLDPDRIAEAARDAAPRAARPESAP
jgi:DNA-binding MarR family transcriptional regulator